MSSSWGHDITVKAIEGLIVFLIVVSIYISIRFQWRMAVGGILALLHDLLIAAGIYSIVGFEVTPSTVVGLLTILGFSLYDTVVVYDKVAENSKDLLAGSRMTFSEAANLAVNQTLMRSINTSLIALLPVAGLLFVGAGILGVGTIKDLALILFVGLASGAYSSLFLATPIVVDLTEARPGVQGADQASRGQAGQRGGPGRQPPRRWPALPRGADVRRPVHRAGRGGPAPAPRPAPGRNAPTPQAVSSAAATPAPSSPGASRRCCATCRTFRSPGIVFKDITPLLADGAAFDARITALAEFARATGPVDLVAGIEARGFLIAGALACAFGCGLVPVRKAGKLPPPTVRR